MHLACTNKALTYEELFYTRVRSWPIVVPSYIKTYIVYCIFRGRMSCHMGRNMATVAKVARKQWSCNSRECWGKQIICTYSSLVSDVASAGWVCLSVYHF